MLLFLRFRMKNREKVSNLEILTLNEQNQIVNRKGKIVNAIPIGAPFILGGLGQHSPNSEISHNDICETLHYFLKHKHSLDGVTSYMRGETKKEIGEPGEVWYYTPVQFYQI